MVNINPKIAVTINMSKTVKKEIQEYAKKSGRTISGTIEYAWEVFKREELTLSEKA